MEAWDPMADDYNDKSFNRYSEGVGRDLLDSSRGNSSGCRLFVGNIPKNLGHEGLFNLFAEYGKVEEARLIETDKEFDFGFVTMRSAVDSETAIRKLHQKKLGKAVLKVDVAITKEERDRRRQAKERENEIMGSMKKSFDWDENKSAMSEFSDLSRRDVRNRHNVLPMGGKGRGNPSGIERGGFGFPTPFMNSGRGNVHPMMPFGNLGPMPFLPGMGRAGGRFGGGGMLPNPGMVGPGPLFPMREQMMQQRQFEAQNKAPYIDIQVPENPRLKDMKCCTLCRKDGCKNLCSGCRLYYCSVECQKQDWPNHKDICAAFREYYKMKGAPNISKQPKENGRLSGGSDSDSRKKDKEKKFLKNSRPAGRYESDHDESDGRKPRVEPLQKGNAPAQISSAQSKGDFKTKKAAKPFNKNESVSSEGQENSMSKFQQNSEKEEQQKEEVQGVPGGAGDATYGHIQMTIPVGSSGKAYLTHYESPYKFWISLVDHLEEFTETTLLIAKQAASRPPSAPKPKDTFGALWEGEWARLEIVSVSGDKATVFFMDYGNTGVVNIKDLRPLTLDIVKLPAQALCCCVSKIKPKGNAWSEAAISKVSEWFGPPMSKYFNFEVVAKRGSKNAVKVSIDNEALSEMLLSQDLGERDSGEPGLPSITAAPKQGNGPSRFTVKELKSELDQVNVGDQLTTLLLACQSVERIIAVKESAVGVLPEVEKLMVEEGFAQQPTYRAAAGDVVAAVFSEDQKWYRAHVLSVAGETCSLFFVDYGNAEDQRMENIREIQSAKLKAIPAQALSCSLHNLDKISSTVTEDDIATEFAQLLPQYQVDGARTLLSVKAKSQDRLVVDVVSTGGLSLVETLLKNFPQAETSKTQASPSNKKAVEGSSIKTSFGDSMSTATGKPLKTESKPFSLKGEQLPIDPDKAVSVMVTYILNCGQFYVRPSANEQKFEVMSAKLNKSARGRPKFLEPPTAGSLAMVQFSVDKHWYRGRVLSVEPAPGERCKVMFIDYGNCEVVPWADLKELEPAMCQLPAQAVRCCLAGEVEQLEKRSHKEFKEYLENEIVDIKVVGGDVDSVAVQMYAHGTDINSHIFGTHTQTPQKMKIDCLVLKPGNPTKVECVNLLSPAAFYVQVTSQVPVTIKLTQDLTTRLEKAPEPVTSVAVGDFVASKFSEDSDVIWYRGRVDKIQEDKALVYFVDFGNFEKRDKRGLMCLSATECSVPAATLKCQLIGCPKSSPEMDAKFTKEGQSQIDSISVINQTDQICVVDVLNSEGHCITNMFHQAQQTSSVKCQDPPASVVSQPSPPVKSPAGPSAAAPKSLPTQSLGEVNSSTDVGVTEIKSFSSIYVTSTDPTLQTKLLELMVALNETAESLPQLPEATQGSLCAARFSLDNNWYRARIVSKVSPTTCEVQFVDYGNSEHTQTSELKALVGDDRFLQLPAQAVKCCLVGFESDLASSNREMTSSEKDEVARLKAELLEKPVRVKLLGKVGDTSVVDIENEQHQFMSSLFKRSSATDANIPKLSDLVHEKPTEKHFDAIILQLTSLDDFYCHRCNEKEMSELTKLGELLESDIRQLPAGVTVTPVVNGLYASKFQNVWYRCVIEKFNGSKVLIRYVDFGNSEEKSVSELRPLNRQRLTLPVRILKCKLYGVSPVLPGWAHPDIPLYLNMLSEKKLQLDIRGEEEDGTLLVSLLVPDGQDMVDVGQDLIKIGLARQLEAVAAAATSCQVQETGDDVSNDNVEEEDEMELAKKIEQLQKMLEETKLKKKTKVTKK